MKSRPNMIIEINHETGVTILVMLIWMKTVLVDYFRASLLQIPILYAYPDEIVNIIFIVAIILALNHMMKYVVFKDVGIYLVILLVYFVNLMVYPVNHLALELYAPRFLIWSVPLIFVGISMDIDKQMKLLYRISLITLYGMVFYVMVLGNGNTAQSEQLIESGQMQNSYFLLPHVLTIIMMAINKPNILNIATSLFGFVLTVSFGTRGPIIAIITFVVVYMVIVKKWKRPIISKAIVLTCFGIIMRMFDPILKLLADLSKRLKLSPRVFLKIMDGDFFVSEGRDNIKMMLYDAIERNPWRGYGIAGDRALGTVYAHNIIIELLVAFGVIIGPIIFIALCVILIRGLLSAKSNYEKGYLLVLMCASFFKLFLSGTYLDESLLYLLIGLCIHLIRKQKKLVLNSEEKTTVEKRRKILWNLTG